MTRTSIRQFRATLTNGSGTAADAYRALARRPQNAASLHGGWIPWGVASSTGARRGDWTPWSAAADRPAGVAFAAWGNWSGPPAHASRA